METEIWKYYLVKILHAVHNPHFSMATCHYTNSKFKIKLKKKKTLSVEEGKIIWGTLQNQQHHAS